LNFLKNTAPDPSTDKELADGFRETGDAGLLSRLYQRYMDLVYGVCLKYFKDGDRSKDAVMDIYTELHQKLRHHEVVNFKSWLHVLTRNHCLMQLRSPRNLKTTEFKPEFMQNGQNEHLNGEAIEKEENFKKLESCIDRLPPDQKQSIALFYLENKCYNEIAELTGLEWNKVRSHIQNGKRNLKICMEQGTIKKGSEQ